MKGSAEILEHRMYSREMLLSNQRGEGKVTSQKDTEGFDKTNIFLSYLSLIENYSNSCGNFLLQSVKARK